ncbi:Mov34/MPN/PAD-1 family protein [Hydrogenophaga sp. 5NK40-0174]|uniref:Mov34/MPN/PAD-1 family protein n=1 Tax=Hydrogenophaga sp. 5NK40-0174 TaxID=3127649 RepID=UPI003342942E
MVKFALPGAEWSLQFDEAAVSMLQRRMQRWARSKESVGQLFTNDLTASTIVISKATSLKALHASWSTVAFDPFDAMRQRQDLLQEGLYCIGLWHTHPEAVPEPSGCDERLAADHARAATTILNGLAFVIIGNRPFPHGWYVGFHDMNRFLRAEISRL